MMDRAMRPPVKTIKDIKLLPVEKSAIGSNTMLYHLPDSQYELFQVTLVFPAGKWYEKKKGVAGFTARMLREGSTKHSALEIATQIDELGAEIDINISSDFLTVKAMAITRQFEAVMDLLKEIIHEPIFPEKELELKKQISKQQLLVNLEKVEYLASREFMGLLYGKDSPYGYRLDEKTIEAVKRDDLVEFHKEFILGSPVWIFSSGKFPAGFDQIIEDVVAGLNLSGKKLTVDNTECPHLEKGQKSFVKKENTQQDAIRIGRHLFTPKHPDADAVKILTTILGGYFGSRLMKNIREEKGFTYGIYSTIQSYVHGSFLYLATEVGRNYLEPALHEIYKEITRLREEPVPDSELELVRNYLLGNALNAIDGPHKAISLYKNLILLGKGPDDFKHYIQRVQNIDSKELLNMAVKYFDPAIMLEVIAGEK